MDGRIDVSLSISPIKDNTGKVVGASAIARDVTDQKLLTREVLAIARREQQRIGQDLHDGTGQELTGLAMMAERLAGELCERSLPQAHTAAKIVDGLEQALRHVRALSKGLVPVELDAEGLMAVLANLAARTSELQGVTCAFQCDEPVAVVDNQTATHLYRLSQEAVTNALKHGRAHKIVISLVDDGELITLAIADDGGVRRQRPADHGHGLADHALSGRVDPAQVDDRRGSPSRHAGDLHTAAATRSLDCEHLREIDGDRFKV